jgi:hypothetical protein
MLKYTEPKFKKTFRFFDKLKTHDVKPVLEKYGKLGVSALSAATPVDSGEAASSWSYKIKGKPERYKLIWTNKALAGNAPLVLMIQYGHATKSGSWYSGHDFINPAIVPIYKQLNKALAKEVIG